jgi:PAS domain-containing protein
MLERLLPFLDIVLLEQDSAGSFKGLVPFPAWFHDYYPEAKAPETALTLDWNFLTDFLTKAGEFWNAGEEGAIVSGPWSETDISGNEKMLQATAILSSGRKILLIEPARVPLEEAQVLLQKGRQKNLDFRTVKRKQRSLRKVQQRYLTLLDAVPDWVLVIHKDGSLLEYSAGREELFEEIELKSGKKVGDLLPPDFAEQLLPQLENVISSGRPQMWKYREGSSRSIEILLLATGEDEAMCILRPRAR